jgi:hypothetical protein
MNKLALAAIATAICTTAPGFVPQAEAGLRIGFGFGHRHHFYRPHFPPAYAYRRYRDDDDDDRRVRRYRSTRKPSKVEQAEKPAKKVPLVKFADGEGRQFDPASKVWFDGKDQCWSGSKGFTFKNGSWFYGSSSWTETGGGWQVTGAEAPELVSCESVPSFAEKANAFAAKQATPPAVTKPAIKAVEAEKPATKEKPAATATPKIKTAETDASTSQKPTVPAAECKKYFPSVGQLIPVPCTE